MWILKGMLETLVNLQLRYYLLQLIFCYRIALTNPSIKNERKWDLQ